MQVFQVSTHFIIYYLKSPDGFSRKACFKFGEAIKLMVADTFSKILVFT